MRGRSVVIGAALLFLGTAALDAQVAISGQVDLLASGGYDRPLNAAVRGDDPFSELRMRLYGQHWVNERVGVFTELLFDLRADARVNGAYVVIQRLGDKEWLNARVGMVPSPVGNFGMRSTYFNQNPLIGMPLLWQYRTTLDPGGRATAQELSARRVANNVGLPVMYDACWPIVIELSGAIGRFDYAVAGSAGAVSNAIMSLREPGWQGMARLGLSPTLGFRVGASVAYGPYIGDGGRTPALVAGGPVPDPAGHHQMLAGYDLEFARGRVQIFSEGYLNRWETPGNPDGLDVATGYVEGRFDVAPQLYLAGRFGGMDFGRIDVGGRPESWDDDLWRFEGAIGYRVAREVLARVGWQRWHYTTGADPDQDVVALQLSAVF